MPEEFAVELKAVAKKFGAVTAVNDVSLQIKHV
jgi:ABC-type Fe3+/spermidine/putrescine transport system ATPase subunit